MNTTASLSESLKFIVFDFCDSLLNKNGLFRKKYYFVMCTYVIFVGFVKSVISECLLS